MLQDIPNHSENVILHMDPDDTLKALGLLWNSHQDMFMFFIPQIDTHRRVTKRTILSDTAQVFDPLGLINPIIVMAKVLLQQLWSLHLDWR